MIIIISDLDRIISNWPGVNHRQTKAQIVFSVGSKNFCWLSYRSKMVQLWPPLGPNSITRFLERDGHKMKIIHRKTGKIDAVYDDPLCLLRECWSYPGFNCKGNLPEAYLDLTAYLDLMRQSYEKVKMLQFK